MKEVYTLADLESRKRLDEGSTQPARLAVIGHPVAHSASPRMHQPALDARGINARYVRIDIEPGDIARAFEAMQRLDFIGCNVTVPHKIEAMDCCDEIDAAARAIGAVNTVRFEGNKAAGYNTDGPGFQRAVEEDFGIRLAEARVMLIGAGGAGQAIAAQCALTGVRRLLLANRTLHKADEVAGRLDGLDIETIALDDPALAERCAACDLIVNTSSVGLKPGDPSILPGVIFKPTHRVYDTIYAPPVTPLLAAAAQAGCRTANGLSMLIHQGALAFGIWFPGENPLAGMRVALGHLGTS